MKHYSILRADSVEGLEDLVNSAIEKGFTPLGPPKCILWPDDDTSDEEERFMQAVYKSLNIDEKV